jgi:hypothetical protein
MNTDKQFVNISKILFVVVVPLTNLSVIVLKSKSAPRCMIYYATTALTVGKVNLTNNIKILVSAVIRPSRAW